MKPMCRLKAILSELRPAIAIQALVGVEVFISWAYSKPEWVLIVFLSAIGVAGWLVRRIVLESAMDFVLGDKGLLSPLEITVVLSVVGVAFVLLWPVFVTALGCMTLARALDPPD